MSMKLSNSFVSTSIPGSYIHTTVQSNPVGLGSSGIVAIIGEADGGDKNSPVSSNSFGPDQLSLVQQTYVSGPIVDAFRALSAPSADTDITSSANRILIVKTNNSLKASALVDTDYGTLLDKNFGINGNKYKFQITQVASETAPVLTGNTIPALGAALNASSFSIRLNGGAATVVTLSATATDHDTVAHLVTELNTLLPVGIVASPGLSSNTLELTVSVDAAANRKGFGKSFELIDSTPGDLAALGLTASLTVSSQEPSVEVSVIRPDNGTNQVVDVTSDIAMSIGYQGATCTMTINQTTKTLVTTGVNPLSIDLTQYKTCSDLAAFISSQTGYSCSVSSGSNQLPTSALDAVVTTIASSSSNFKPGRIKKASYNFQKALSTSTALSFVPTVFAGLPAPMSMTFLTGGAKGATLAADVVSAIDQLATVQVNIIVPLFSRDASLDITDGLTDSSSTYTIDAVNAAVKNHCIQYSTPKLKRNRICVLSKQDTFTNIKAAAQTIANFRCSLVMQQASQVDSTGAVKVFAPWYTACVAAGMQTGGFYKSITNKFANVISFIDPSGFDSGSPSNVEDALDAGLMFLTKEIAGNRWVSDQTSYGFDTSFVYNSMQAVYASDLLALDLMASFQAAFVGKSLADVNAGVAYAFLATKMDGYKKIKLIAGSDDAPLGWKNGKVSISAPTMNVEVEIKLATAIYFIPISLNISAVQQTA